MYIARGIHMTATYVAMGLAIVKADRLSRIFNAAHVACTASLQTDCPEH